MTRTEWPGRITPEDRWLTDWRDAHRTYRPGDEHRPPANVRWKEDHHRHRIGYDATGDLLRAARDLLFRYEFYPPDVMVHAADYHRQQRPMRPGDRIVQRIYPIPALRFLSVLTMTEVSAVEASPTHARFVYVTTTAHREIGWWAAGVEWDPATGELVATIDAVSRTGPGVPFFLKPYTRWLQLRAHRRGLDHFTALILARRP